MKTLMTLALTATAALLAGAASAADLDVRLSAREAYVGMPITMQIAIRDAADFETPNLPSIDGCDIRSAGAPAQSSQVTIINGRRSESRSVTMQYLITPRREGTFEIPAFSVEVDGKRLTAQSQRFVATKSMTGDLLFVEIEGGKKKVFVGEPLDLTLKLWLKPYRDMDRDLTLSEGDMWKMISEQTSWGGFTARMKELDENNQRPGGQEVLRDDGQGNQRSYYLYEISATVYPKRPGRIDANDVQIVVNYPTSLGKSRSPFDSMFEDSPFGGRSPFSSMMNDDFFRSSFGNRLTVSSSRPIVGEANVDATEVMPVPEEGRPADYRGAVGRYQIVTQATPTTVNAGDPITLNIGIAGTGPMELVQAPPLSELQSLTDDFKVADESLAGFVQDDTKVFSTTIRPRREGISEIPAIRFSFFDPDTQSFETVTSDPIGITVNKAEMLAMDAIVGSSRSTNDPSSTNSSSKDELAPDFANKHSASVLVSTSPRPTTQWWWIFVIAPPLAWLVTWLFRHHDAVTSRLPSIGSVRRRSEAAIERAKDEPSLIASLACYISERSGKPCSTPSQAIGALRVTGLYEIANEVESYFHELERLGKASPAESTKNFAMNQAKAFALVDRLENEFSAKKNRIRLPKGHRSLQPIRRTVKRSTGLLLAASVALSAGNAMASDPTPMTSCNSKPSWRKLARPTRGRWRS